MPGASGPKGRETSMHDFSSLQAAAPPHLRPSDVASSGWVEWQRRGTPANKSRPVEDGEEFETALTALIQGFAPGVDRVAAGSRRREAPRPQRLGCRLESEANGESCCPTVR